jgi:diguanylate cyclase (GGDEF)-like protein/PAS domain S-box-containing protein
MSDEPKTNAELIEEISCLNRKIRELERSESERKRAEEALRESETNLQAIFDTVGTAILIIDGDTQVIVDANQTALEMTGQTKERIVGQVCHSLVCPALKGKCPVKDLGQSIDHAERKLLHADGNSRDILKTVHPITINERYCYLESFIDISDRKRAEEVLRESEEKYRLVVENAAEIILIAQDGFLKYVNPMAVKILGYPKETLTSTPFVELLHPDDLQKVFEAHARIMRGEETPPVHEFRVLTADGTVRWADSRAVVISWEGKPATLNFITDITDRKRMESEIFALSITDHLTSLHNRRGFLSLAGQQLKLAERNKSGLLLFFADLDGLKSINDTLGHEEGDKALVEAATVFKESFRASDIIARLGGDEFAALTVDITNSNFEIFAARLQSLMDTRNNQENRRYRLSISIGCSCYDPEHPCSLDELIARADRSMYEQKQNRKCPHDNRLP